MRGDPPQPSRRAWRPFLPKSSVPATRSSGRRSGGSGGEKEEGRAEGRQGGAAVPCSGPSSAFCRWLLCGGGSEQFPASLHFCGSQQMRSSSTGRVPQLKIAGSLLIHPQPGDPVGVTDHPCICCVCKGHLVESAFQFSVH